MLSQQEISDHIEIGQLIQRYGLALDEKNFDLLDTVFTSDARMSYQLSEQPTVAEYAQWKPIFTDFMTPFYWTEHMLSPPVIELDGDQAHTTTRLIATHVQLKQSPTGEERSVWTVLGFYRDRLVRTATGWRIAERSFRSPHAEGALDTGEDVKQFPQLPWD